MTTPTKPNALVRRLNKARFNCARTLISLALVEFRARVKQKVDPIPGPGARKLINVIFGREKKEEKPEKKSDKWDG